MLYIASLNDQVVPIYSGIFTCISHPLVLRSLYIDGDAYKYVGACLFHPTLTVAHCHAIALLIFYPTSLFFYFVFEMWNFPMVVY